MKVPFTGDYLVMSLFLAAVVALCVWPQPARPQLPPKVEVTLTPEVRYAIQEEVRRQVRKVSKPVLPMVVPDARAVVPKRAKK